MMTTQEPIWKKTKEGVEYPQAIVLMEQHITKMLTARAPELIWLLEHPSLYTLGSRGNEKDILVPGEIPVYHTGRGGQVTYHGPGQRVGYVMLDLTKRQLDLRQYIHRLEAWLIDTLYHLGIPAERRHERIGVWVTRGSSEAKIAAIGVRIRKGMTFHGFSLNVAPDLGYFDKIIPCGLKNYGVTSLEQLGLSLSLEEIDHMLEKTFPDHFP